MPLAPAAHLRSLSLLALLLSATSAHAADETDITPFLHAKAGIGYRGQFVQGQYVRDGETIAAREEERQFVDFDVRFGAWYGLETFLRFSHDNWDRVRWQDVAFSGTAVPGEVQEHRKGITDIVVGGKYALLSEARKTGDVSTWTVETSFKVPGSFEVYPDLDPGKGKEAPAGNPAFEWLLKTSFSKRVRFFDPYVSFYYLHRGTAAEQDGVGEFNLADQWGTYFGTEVVGFERPADNLKFSGDVAVGWRYVMEGEIPTNRFLYGPDSGQTAVPAGDFIVREQGYIRYDLRLGFFYQLQKRVQARGALTYGLPTEHYIEAYDEDFADPAQGGRVRNKEFTDFGYHFTMLGTF